MLEAASGMVKKIERITIAVIDFPTTRVEVVCAAMNQVRDIWQRANSGRACRFRVLVFCNARFDLVAFVQDKALGLWPVWRAMVMPLRMGQVPLVVYEAEETRLLRRGPR